MAPVEGSPNKLRVFLIPYFATGQLIPMTDLARLLAANPNVEPTIVTTPANADIIRPSLASAGTANTVRILTYPFPSVGLPSGVENFATAPSDESWRIDQAAQLSQPAHDSLLRAHQPDAIIADSQFWWTTPIANELSIPGLTYHSTGIFSNIVMNNLFQILPDILSRKDQDPHQSYVSVPDLPGPQISMPVSELPEEFLREESIISDIWENIVSCRLNGSGAVVNTSYDLESDYYETYMKTIDPKTYSVGLLGLNPSEDKMWATKRGGHGNIDCLGWLDKMSNRSVVFVSFGSSCHFSMAQLHELALGLEESGKNFLWVVKGGKGTSEEWMPEEWVERVKSRGLVVWGWVPQVAILRHASVGAFLTHCGWNSILEAMSTGVPMLTWPLVFDQFINEKFVVEVKGCGARVWEGGKRSTREAEKGVVAREVISKAVSRFMESGGVGETARAKAEEMATLSHNATTRDGDGSSQKDLSRLIDDLFKAKRK